MRRYAKKLPNNFYFSPLQSHFDNRSALMRTQATILAGETTASVPFEILQDDKIEPPESFFLNLSSPQNATIANRRSRVTILDDDSVREEIEFRSIDGSGNNERFDDQGAAETQVIRFGYPAGYFDVAPNVPGDEGIGDDMVDQKSQNIRKPLLTWLCASVAMVAILAI